MRLSQFVLAAALGLAVLPLSGVSSGAGVAFAQQPTPPTPPTPPVAAAATVSAEIMIIHGTNEGTGIEPSLRKIPELGKPPFSSYNSYKLVETKTLTLEKGKAPATLKLPNERVLGVALKDVIAPNPKDKKDVPKYVVSASIQNPGKKDFLPQLDANAKVGSVFFVAGQTYRGGMLVIGIRILP